MLFLVGAVGVIALFVFIIWVSRKAMKNAKKMQYLEEAGKYKEDDALLQVDVRILFLPHLWQLLTAFQIEDDFTMLLNKPLEGKPFQVENDPVLTFFGMAYDTNPPEADSDSDGVDDGGAGFI